MVALQILVLSAQVRILVPQHGKSQPRLALSALSYLLSTCTPRGEGEGSPSAATPLSPLSACGLRLMNFRDIVTIKIKNYLCAS